MAGVNVEDLLARARYWGLRIATAESCTGGMVAAALTKYRTPALIAISSVVVLGALGYLMYGGVEENLVYFLTPNELVAKGEKAIDRPVRLGGQVVPGSVPLAGHAGMGSTRHARSLGVLRATTIST